MSTPNEVKQSRIDESTGRIVGAIGGQVPDVMSTSTFAGVTVISVDGHNAGRVFEIMADVRDVRVAYAVLAEGKFLGTGLTLPAISWSALIFDIENE